MPMRLRGVRNKAQMIDAMAPWRTLRASKRPSSLWTSSHSTDSPTLKERCTSVLEKGRLGVFRFGATVAFSVNSPVIGSARMMLPRWAFKAAMVSERIERSNSSRCEMCVM